MKTARRVMTLILSIVFLIAGFTAVVILPRDEASAQQENRKLADFPSFFLLKGLNQESLLLILRHTFQIMLATAARL